MSDILSAISAVASAVAAVSASVAIWPAHRAATEARKQNNIQTKVQKEVLQPYLWVDIQPTFAQGNLLQIVLANEGPTVATNVQVVFDPKIPPATAGLDKSEVAQSRKVILGVSWVISGRRYDDGPPPWGIMGVKETSP